MRGLKSVMKGQKQARINLDRLRAGNALKKSNEQLRSSLTQNATPPRRNRFKMSLALGGLALGVLAFGAVQCSSREAGVHQCWQSQIPGFEETLS